MTKHQTTSVPTTMPSVPFTASQNAIALASGAAPSTLSGWNMISAEIGDHVDLYIYGAIGDYWEGNTAIDLVRMLLMFPDLKSITVHLNSEGGLIMEGLAMLATLRSHVATVNVIIEGIAASIASLIMLSADKGKLSIVRTAFIYIHNASNGLWGTASDHDDAATQLRQQESVLIKEYTAKTGKSEQEMQALVDAGTLFTAEEALEIGLVDEIIDPIETNTSATAQNKLPPAWMSRNTLNINELNSLPAEVIAQMTQKSPNTAAPASAQTAAPATAAPIVTAAATAIAAPKTATEPANSAVTAPVAAPIDSNNLAAQVATTGQVEWQAAEAQRRNDVANLFEQHGGIAGDHAQLATACQNDFNCTTENARELLLNAIGQQAPQSTVAGGFNNVRIVQDERDTRIDLAVNALHSRSGLATAKPNNPYAYKSLMRLAEDCLASVNIQTQGHNPLSIVGRAFNMQSSSDFPIILERTISEAIIISYGKVADTWRNIVKIGQVSDFRYSERLRFGALGSLDALNEAGEYKNKAIPDGEKERIQAKTKGNIIGITREAIINDDLGYFMSMSKWLGQAAASTIEKTVYDVLLSNKKLSDGYPLLHAKHNNIATGSELGAISESTLDPMAIKMAAQKDISAVDELGIEPAILLVPRKHKMLANKWMNSTNIPVAGDASRNEPNGVMGLADVIASSKIKEGYYLLSSPDTTPVIEVVFLNGIEEPYIDTSEGWRTDGTEMKVRLDFGVAPIDYRGIQFNKGA